MLAVSVLSAGLVLAGIFARPTTAFAEAQRVKHIVALAANGTTTQFSTDAPTVGEFLRQRGITVQNGDFVSPSIDTPIYEQSRIEYDRAMPVRIVTAHSSVDVNSAGSDVGAVLEEQHVAVNHDDEVTPSLAQPLQPNMVIRVVRVTQWTRNQLERVAPQVEHRLVFSMRPGSSKVIDKGRDGTRVKTVHFTQRDGGAIVRTVVASRMLRKPQPRVIAEGVGEYEAFARFAEFGTTRAAYLLSRALSMIATAYTADCIGCNGRTALGYPAGHGIVAVDPRVIPLRTRLYIPGYGVAIAGDTGGAIKGNRIDLGFNSNSDARRFGRREITVYRLK